MTLKDNVSRSEKQQLIDRAKRIYEDELQERLVGEFEGNIIVVDGRTGEYEIGDHASSAKRLRERCPDAVTYTARIGSDHVYEIPSLTVITDVTSAAEESN